MADTPNNLSSWQAISYPSGGGGNVTSVNSQTGVVVLGKTDVGLGNVDNTTDANKPVSAAQQTALNGKENTLTAGTTAQYLRGDKSWQTLDKTSVGLGNVDNTTDANKPVSTAQQTALNAKENTLTAGTTAQYLRGDKSWQTLDKTSVGLGNVDNTTDANKPVSTAQQTELDKKLKKLFTGDYFLWRPSSGTNTGTGVNYPQQTSGTVSHPALASGSLTSRLRRTRFTGAASASSVAGIRTNVGQVSLLDGFLVQTRFAIDSGTDVAGVQAFIGLWASTSILNANPSTLTNLIGIGFDTTDSNTGNWFLIYNDASGTATKVDIGASMPRNSLQVTYDFIISAAPGAGSMAIKLINRHTEATVLDTTVATDLPSSTTFLTHHATLKNGSTTQVMVIDVMSIYGEVNF
ncbi:MAG: hypothetical protein MUE85_06925 [Microscillaceae bacterium]|nr:hypothetical protein [Microscillaceae bacterium]